MDPDDEIARAWLEEADRRDRAMDDGSEPEIPAEEVFARIRRTRPAFSPARDRNTLMIQRLTVSNYRSLGKGVTVDFGRFTALVGPNGSGKSNVVDALRFVSDAMHMGLSSAIVERGGVGRRMKQGHPWQVSIQLDLQLDEDQDASYLFRLSGDRLDDYVVDHEEARVRKGTETFTYQVARGKWLAGPPDLNPILNEKSLSLPIIGGDVRFQPLAEALLQIALYTIFPDTLRAPQKHNLIRPMDRHGSNWASILKDQSKETWKPELVSALHKLTGDIEDIRLNQAGGYLFVEFLHKWPEKGEIWWSEAARESDGTLRVAGILTALLQEPPVPVIGIEEPELTVHPSAIPLLFDFLNQASRRSQILVTTHSPELLDLIDVDDVRVVLRGPKGTSVARISTEQRDAVRNKLLSLGDVLRTEGLQQELPTAAE
jgi:predicted ATPase